jgi:hypothetical protein
MNSNLAKLQVYSSNDVDRKSQYYIAYCDQLLWVLDDQGTFNVTQVKYFSFKSDAENQIIALQHGFKLGVHTRWGFTFDSCNVVPHSNFFIGRGANKEWFAVDEEGRYLTKHLTLDAIAYSESSCAHLGELVNRIKLFQAAQ